MRPDSKIVSEESKRISAAVDQLMNRADTYETIGAAIGLTAQSVGRKMRGEREWSGAEVARLAAYFAVSSDVLLAGDAGVLAGVGGGRRGHLSAYLTPDSSLIAA